MEFRVLDNSLIAIDTLDNVDSIIWVERYSKVGEFELYMPVSTKALSLLQEEYFLQTITSERTMIIESIGITTDPEIGNKLLVKGRTIESLLDRRIVAGGFALFDGDIDATFQDGIEQLLNENVIANYWPARDFPNWIFSASTDPLITALTLKGKFYSQNLLDVITSLCVERNVGFKVILNQDNEFVFSLYAGVDRSYDQLTNPYIVFSPNFDNLLKSDYFTTKKYKKNYALITGDPTASILIRAQIFGNDFGLDRREMFVDASDISKFIEDSSTEIDDLVYKDMIKQRGGEVLSVNTAITMFEGEVDLSHSYKYGTDFFLGDMIQIVDDYGHAAKAQILEMTFSENLSGTKIYPTLKTI